MFLTYWNLSWLSWKAWLELSIWQTVPWIILKTASLSKLDSVIFVTAHAAVYLAAKRFLFVTLPGFRCAHKLNRSCYWVSDVMELRSYPSKRHPVLKKQTQIHCLFSSGVVWLSTHALGTFFAPKDCVNRIWYSCSSCVCSAFTCEMVNKTTCLLLVTYHQIQSV